MGVWRWSDLPEDLPEVVILWQIASPAYTGLHRRLKGGRAENPYLTGLFAIFRGIEVEPKVGIEPTTYGLRNRCSTTELLWLPLASAKIGDFLGTERKKYSFARYPDEY